MNFTIVIFALLEFIFYSKCLVIKEFDYIIVWNKIADSEVISVINVDSFIQCSIQCSAIQECSHANFRDSNKCELCGGDDFNIEDEMNSAFICNHNMCHQLELVN